MGGIESREEANLALNNPDHTTANAEAVEANGVPELPDDATPAQREAYWYRHIYRGDSMKQLSVRAVLMGGAIGMLMSVAGLYTTLKIGWSFGVAITSCVISYVFWNILRAASGNRLSQMTILENNCMQSTASAAGYSTGATIATAFGALLLLTTGEAATKNTWELQAPWIVASFTFFTACLGVFLAIPMKRQMINIERLPFPSGIAAAATLKSLYSKGQEASRKATALVISLLCGALVGVLNTGEGGLKFIDNLFMFFREKLFRINLPEAIPEGGYMKWHGKGALGFFFEPSVLLVAAGMIVGLRVSLSMLAGSLILYLGVGPWLVGMDVANANVEGYKRSIDVVAGGTLYHFPRWALWGGTSVMVFASLAALALQWRTVLRSFGVGKKNVSEADATDPALEAKIREIEVPNSWLVIGLIPISIGLITVNYLAFQMNPILGAIAVAMSFVLSMVACRATGETDTTPIGAMGKVMQLLFAILPGAKGDQTINLMSASTAANSASSSADLLTDLKSGYILGANPRQQFLAQFAGLFFGTLAIVPAWYLLVPDKAALEKFNPPATNMWKAVAELLAGKEGLNALPDTAKWAIVIGALVGIILPVLEKLFPKARPYLPSAMGLGLSWVVTFSNSYAFAIGAVIAWAWSLMNKKNAERYTIPVASGLVAGESLIKAILAMLATASGLLHWKL